MSKAIEEARASKDSLGGVISAVVSGLPIGLGEPVFDKLHADLGKSLLSINAVKGIEIGNGFAATRLKGSENNDAMGTVDGNVKALSNNAGGLLGGISNGEDLTLRLAFKPTSTIGKPQRTVSKDGAEVELEASGRHDPCVLPRAVPIVESMICLTLADHYLRNRISRL